VSTLTSTAPAAPSATRALVPLAWGALLVGSALPLVAASRLPALRPLADLLRWLLALTAGWHLVVGGITAQPAWQTWQHSVPWVVRGTVVQGLVAVPSFLLLLLGIGRDSRRTLRLDWGDGAAAAAPDLVTLGRRPAWRRLGLFWAVGISLGTLIAMSMAIRPDASLLSRLLPVLPLVLVLAATNTVNEEFQFRNVPLAVLPGAIGTPPALLVTAACFGLEHYYGNPPGLSGVVLATFLGYLLGKSMLETGGSRWAWLIHWLQDVIIFSFLAMGWSR
jgi:hypothetical protein